MANFDIIPYVFEVARRANGVTDRNQKFVMRYEEYGKYVKMFEEMSDSEKMDVVNRVKRIRVK